MRDSSQFSPIADAIAAFRAGRMVILVDDEERENEGDLAIAAEKVTPEAIAFMATHGRGLICLALTEERCDQLGLPPMVAENTSPFGTAFTVSIEARGKVTTGISAADRAATVRTAIDPATRPDDLLRPGHMFPLRARRGGVLKRTGQTEASVDLARLAGLDPSAVICEIMKDDGTMARVPDLLPFAARHGLPIVTVADLIRYRLRHETIVERLAAPRLPTAWGEFRICAYRAPLTGEEHVALVLGEVDDGQPVLVRVHSQCLTGDVFGSERCDCGVQLYLALDRIAAEGRGVLLYLMQEGRGIGLVNKLRAYELQEAGHDTVEANERLGFRADQRDYGVGAQILRDLGVRRMRLLSNNPSKFVGLRGYGLEIVERLPLEVPPTVDSRAYLRTKREKLGHLLSLV
ncbi:MAG: bifunctional 3,4-dihydroxy-2-butanone-4-phosphate synthase/GTP cyclohydrolase II [Acidobacteria bacterium]|jgi:3,4-dihydroxy 2-butanone 4-phosphate synthase/GTP cyclohydrolase II|nr:bifunctional 3,4-dihydroxy-2-butanone-4-phosphate synthase/GTP cyclohydrolase II [Thermoanaerobaculia bacterium]MDI9630467.1 bifunctional 3,4-dihydroxy-2-butanone-4-phosphate synthase/GTP cyclohydrolase II [Acidobacteriota bacterium]OQC35503.1 MAG: Riboflavin biosynthesis protein RibBA [Acidobacteria bacterium ADurb.Bin051]MBP7813855.1 bifunctional 3,4-dihydroxy-2-butanone-4-phosphate synthase/GTP cyclohydrolase II [Thermoanaerobaculia bacterium]MBP8845872.1 bifunctional 3,4-dihydroxy-2-buta